MLGVRREGVTQSAGRLQKLGIIEYKRGLITVIDRLKLEQMSCECYAVVVEETERLLH
ncbi:MAG: helix-turn-helix domain-containing protein [Arenimonas sp.]